MFGFCPDPEVVLLYTDGAMEENYAGAGAVFILLDSSQPAGVLSVAIPDHLIERWRGRSKHAVAKAEMLPALLARATWVDRLRGELSFISRTIRR
eukprot:5902457-Amphidinium_carterae.1